MRLPPRGVSWEAGPSSHAAARFAILPSVTGTDDSSDDFLAACVQFDVRSGDVAANCASMRAGVEEAVASGARLCVLPEMWSTSFLPGFAEPMLAEAENERRQALREPALRIECWDDDRDHSRHVARKEARNNIHMRMPRQLPKGWAIARICSLFVRVILLAFLDIGRCSQADRAATSPEVCSDHRA